MKCDAILRISLLPETRDPDPALMCAPISCPSSDSLGPAGRLSGVMGVGYGRGENGRAGKCIPVL